MPELPEVEVVRRGLDAHLVGRRIESVEVLHPRAVRRHIPGADDLAARIAGHRVHAVRRRGKYLWLDLTDGRSGDRVDLAVIVHLGMSGQMLLQPPDKPDEKHLRIRAVLDVGDAADGADGEGGVPGVSGAPAGPLELRFVDQRTFGGWMLDTYAEAQPPESVSAQATSACVQPFGPIPASLAHIAPDPFDPAYDQRAVVATLRRKHSEIKRQLLDQTVVSGIGNIYADEGLWAARINGTRLADSISVRKLNELLDAVTAVMRSALDVGGTSFDSLYVNVNGESGYFERSLNAYGRQGLPCRRCGTVMRREAFMNRSSFWCPKCQPRRSPRG